MRKCITFPKSVEARKRNKAKRRRATVLRSRTKLSEHRLEGFKLSQEPQKKGIQSWLRPCVKSVERVILPRTGNFFPNLVAGEERRVTLGSDCVQGENKKIRSNWGRRFVEGGKKAKNRRLRFWKRGG